MDWEPRLDSMLTALFLRNFCMMRGEEMLGVDLPESRPDFLKQ